MKDYLKVPSKAPYAWFVYNLGSNLFMFLYYTYGHGWIFWALWLLSWLFAGFGIIQVIYNLVQLIKTKPRFNFKKVAINLLLFVISGIIQHSVQLMHSAWRY